MTNEVKILGGIGVATLVIVVGAALLFGGNQPAATSKPISKEQQKFLIRQGSHEVKVPGAKVTIVEFGDFQCPACGASYPIVTQILRDYKGKVNFVFREFPLPMHQNAKIAAEAAEAAGKQGKFFPMYDLLYTNQKAWGESGNPLKYFTIYAETLRLNMDQFTGDIKTNAYEKIIQQGIDDGNALQVQATPTFFINGAQQTGGLPYDQFKAKIDAALK